MSKKTIGKILIILGILIAIGGVFILNSKEKSSPADSPLPSEKEKIESQLIKNFVTLKINEQKIDSNIKEKESIAELMTQLQDEGKITFTEKNYAGMGKFIEEINGIKNNGDKNWIYYVNGKKAQIGISNYKLNPGDIVSWEYESSY